MQINKRDRSALRADKYWESVFLRQMLFRQPPLTFVKGYAKTILGNSVNTFQPSKEIEHAFLSEHSNKQQ